MTKLFYCNFKGFKIMEKQEAKFGFTNFAENWNGRLAMLGFVIAVTTELLTGKGILAQLGLM
ncbi:MAG: chlorophyll a/b-binding protein [Xenococcaceae cyanobacterium]